MLVIPRWKKKEEEEAKAKEEAKAAKEKRAKMVLEVNVFIQKQ